MKIYLAGTSSRAKGVDLSECKYILESFYSFAKWQKPLTKNPNFLLDSGAFTFMQGGKVDKLDEYVDRYIQFINENDIKNFFELDVDSVKGYEWVLRAREKIEKGTEKKCIPVWHITRGMSEYRKMCKEYSYVAIGGIASREFPPNKHPALKQLIRIAHEYGCKIHGLGFTYTNKLNQYHFDSVDSTAWKNGSTYGELHKFDNKKIIRIKPPQGMRSFDYKKTELFNFKEWIKFQRWAEEHL